MKTYDISSLCLLILIILASFATRTNAVESDISCLRSVKESLEDPENLLSSWDFNMTEGSFCRFTGVTCWHADENRVLSLTLSGMGLKGSFPTGLKDCTSLTGLDLSSNDISGSIPSNIGDVIPYVTILDLSNNNLSGPIPLAISDCRLINVLRLENNHLTGQIPPELSGLNRIKVFSVANNRLSGPTPVFGSVTFPEESYANNLGLCGGPLDACRDVDREDGDDLFLPGFVVGFPISTTLSMLFMFFYSPKLSIVDMLSYLLPMKKIEKRLHQLIPRSPQIVLEEEISSSDSLSFSRSRSCSYVFNTQVLAMEKLICRMSLMELEMATNEFHDKNVIGHGNIGVMYKGAFMNGLVLAVKRLHKFESLEKEFLTEIRILGRLRQTNLVPLLGFCFEMEKKFLVYKYMCNGTLHHWVHCTEARKMGWALRLKIAVGIARGLAWLHHNNVLRVAHRKINSTCILLDENFEPKISNFGDAMILTNASTGTRPSSACKFVVQDSTPYKEDVYGFGILLVELITGRIPPSTRIKSLTDHVIVIDECLMRQGYAKEIYETHGIAESCIRDDATSMLQVYQDLRSIGISRNEIPITVHSDEHIDEDYLDLSV